MPDGSYALQPREGFASAIAPPEPPLTMTTIEIGDDGGVTIKSPAVHSKKDKAGSKRFSENLALTADHALDGMAQEILDGVDADIASRKAWIDNYTDGLDLLGLTIEDVKNSKQGPASRIGHPLLLGAVVKAQSAASAELMPSRGPCKVTTHEGDGREQDELAQALERDMNYYLTQAAPEYYADFDRGLFGLMLSGNLFKKIYECPIRRRPVSDSISADDLIVSEDAVDLDTAVRITHRAEMAQPQVKRLQWLDHWVGTPLGNPMPPMSPEQRKRDEITGTRPMSLRPKDTPYTIYETTTDLILEDYGLKDPRAPDDLPVSYAVTLDKDSRQILDIRRRWRDGDDMYQRKQCFVHYGMIPALGFLCLGHLHLLGNQTKALRAIWRILVTAGMYATAPAGLKSKTIRMSTNELNPQPGEFIDVDIGGLDDISKAFLNLPYKDPSPVFIQLGELIGKESGQLAMAADVPVGDGRVDIPVGTILATIEQATKMMSAVHKRLYRAQARELTLIRDCFAENPEALWKLNKRPAKKWQTAAEFADLDLVPASDPNVPSQIHRIMLASAMVQMAGTNPDIYDRVAVHKRAWDSIGVNDSETFLHEPVPQAAPDGKAPPDPLIGQARMLEAQARMEKTKIEATDLQRKAANEAVDTAARQQADALQHQSKMAQLASQEKIQAERLQIEQERMAIEQERSSREHWRADQEMAAQHARGLAEHSLGLADHTLAREQHGLEETRQQSEHERGLKELAIKKKVADKPVPKPAAARPKAKKRT